MQTPNKLQTGRSGGPKMASDGGWHNLGRDAKRQPSLLAPPRIKHINLDVFFGLRSGWSRGFGAPYVPECWAFLPHLFVFVQGMSRNPQMKKNTIISRALFQIEKNCLGCFLGSSNKENPSWIECWNNMQSGQLIHAQSNCISSAEPGDLFVSWPVNKCTDVLSYLQFFLILSMKRKTVGAIS